jgi:hypothetical protein
VRDDQYYAQRREQEAAMKAGRLELMGELAGIAGNLAGGIVGGQEGAAIRAGAGAIQATTRYGAATVRGAAAAKSGAGVFVPSGTPGTGQPGSVDEPPRKGLGWWPWLVGGVLGLGILGSKLLKWW